MKTTFWSPEGKPIDHEEFVEQLFGEFPSLFQDEEALRKIWSLPSTRKRLLEELEEKGYSQDQLEDLRQMVHGNESDLFDVLNYIAYAKDLVPRTERAERAKIHLNHYDAKQQEFLNFVLEQYIKGGFKELDDLKLPDLLELKYHGITDAKKELGELTTIRQNFINFQEEIYRDRVG